MQWIGRVVINADPTWAGVAGLYHMHSQCGRLRLPALWGPALSNVVEQAQYHPAGDEALPCPAELSLIRELNGPERDRNCRLAEDRIYKLNRTVVCCETIGDVGYFD
jgi:hypothetical protein